MITLITAVPGSGKTLSAIQLIIDANSKKRSVFTNIAGLQKDKFTHPELIYDAPDDWRDTPHGSLVIYDECQQPHLYPATAQRGAVTDERLTAMETHRHTGHDLVFITQAPTFVHHHVRKLVGEHVHLYRAHGVSGAMRYTWSHTCDNPNDRKEQQRADSTMWKFPKTLFPYYASATIHTHKFKIPKKLFLFLIPAVVLLVPAIYKISSNPFIVGQSPKKPAESALAPAASSLPLVPSSSTSWKLKGYVTVGAAHSVGKSLAVISSVSGTRTIDFRLCDWDEYRLTISCVLDNETISFYTGSVSDSLEKSTAISVF